MAGALPAPPQREEHRTLLALVILQSLFLFDPTDSLHDSVPRAEQLKCKSLNRMKLLQKKSKQTKNSVPEDPTEVLPLALQQAWLAGGSPGHFLP